MAELKQLIAFYRGKHDSYSPDTMNDGIYFCTDKSSIIMNNVEYYSGVKNATVSGETLVIEK